MTKPLHIAPNKPLFVALQDPEGEFDHELQTGRYQTTSGQQITLPRAAVVKLNMLAPAPGEEIVIQKHWSGRAMEPAEWTVSLSTRSELARADAGEADTLTQQLEASLEQAEQKKRPQAIPTPITGPPKREPKPETGQPRLFDRGTGTHGPAPSVQPEAPPVVLAPAAIAPPIRRQPPALIPANVAVKEILGFIAIDPNTQNWSDQARQDLASTIIIAAYKAGHVGLWERAQ